jgi:hypothetical protein
LKEGYNNLEKLSHKETMMKTKKCKNCDIDKKTSKFGKCSANKDGLRNQWEDDWRDRQDKKINRARKC